MEAMKSPNPLISGSYSMLTDLNFPTKLIIYKNYYLQVAIYEDSIPGLLWYVVVLLPAVLDAFYLGTESSYYYIVIFITGLTFLTIFFGFIITIRNYNKRIIKLTRPLFTMIILLGGTLLSISCLFLLDDNNEWRCAARPWMFNLAFTLSFAPFLIKSYMVHLLFNVNPMSRNKLIKNELLISATLLFVVVDVIILSATLYGGNGGGTHPVTTTRLTSNGAYASVTTCAYLSNTAFLNTEIAYKALLIVAACVMSFKVRNVPGTIAGSRTLVAVIYNTAFISLVVILINRSVSDVSVQILCQAVGICLCVILNLGTKLYLCYNEI